MIKGEEIRKRRRALNLSVRELAELLSISENNLYKWEKGMKPSNPEDYLKLEKWLKGEKVETVPENIVSEAIPSRIGKALPEGYKDKAIYNLTESYIALSRSYEELVQLVKGIAKNVTGGADLRTQEVLAAEIGALQELLAASLVKRTRFESVDDVFEALNTTRNALLKKDSQADSRDGLGKHGKSIERGS